VNRRKKGLELLTKFKSIETRMNADKRRFEENKEFKAFFIGVHQRLSLLQRFLLGVLIFRATPTAKQQCYEGRA
jgi:hypothetical protein